MPDQPEIVTESVRTRDGRRLHLERRGTGVPVVVLEAGMGFSHHTWGAVAPLVADRTTVAAYDRSGLGQSAPDPEPRVLSRLADDLIDVLDHLAPGPFVLVGHSWGGPVVRVAAGRVPERIAGLVLVDQTDEGCELYFSAANERLTRVADVLAPILARTGLLRIPVRRLAASLPEPAATGMRTEDGTPAAIRALRAEMATNNDDLRRLRDDPPVVPEVPVTVISGTKGSRIERSRRGELVEAHRARAAALPQGRHVNAERSSHFVPFTEPQLIADEIARILDAGATAPPA